jgi:hypothetical protein
MVGDLLHGPDFHRQVKRNRYYNPTFPMCV